MVAAFLLLLALGGAPDWMEPFRKVPSARPGEPIGALAIDPSDHLTVYAAAFGGSVYRTRDGGRSWQSSRSGADDSCALLVDPARPSTLYLGALEKGVRKSTDGGVSWKAAVTGLPKKAAVHTLV